eukprot:TRINITY_DN10792_c0_g1_i1.p1 TRINITY_DN10792_c0_g1~~TRINITY_DN10792_c0_g1_i1.p1  ORF type:complete len:290 (-),score=78.85 TRINITY_DN10792_c0_g1_i1:9-878(-)
MKEFRERGEDVRVREEEVNVWDVLASTRKNKSTGGWVDYYYSACEIAAREGKELFSPLIDYSLLRLKGIFLRAFDISIESIYHSSSVGSNNKDSIINHNSNKYNTDRDNEDVNRIENYPYFVNYVRRVYEDWVEDISKNCRAKCMDEFVGTETLYWGLNQNQSFSPLGDKDEKEEMDQVRDRVVGIVREVFDAMKKRLLRNLMMKFYNWFVFRFMEGLAELLQSKVVMGMGEEELEKKFQVKWVEEKWRREIERMEKELADLKDKEAKFKSLSTQFAAELVQCIQNNSK